MSQDDPRAKPAADVAPEDLEEGAPESAGVEGSGVEGSGVEGFGVEGVGEVEDGSGLEADTLPPLRLDPGLEGGDAFVRGMVGALVLLAAALLGVAGVLGSWVALTRRVRALEPGGAVYGELAARLDALGPEGAQAEAWEARLEALEPGGARWGYVDARLEALEPGGEIAEERAESLAALRAEVEALRAAVRGLEDARVEGARVRQSLARGLAEVEMEVEGRLQRIEGSVRGAVAAHEALRVELGRWRGEVEEAARAPVGTVRASLLGPEAFSQLVNGCGYEDVDRGVHGWVLADGGEASARYRAEVGAEVVPDLRGVFLRGMNHGGGADPEVGRRVGSVQEEAVGAHRHPVGRSAPTAGLGVFAGALRPVVDGSEAADGVETGDPVGPAGETRPRNVAVYFYVRIN